MKLLHPQSHYKIGNKNIHLQRNWTSAGSNVGKHTVNCGLRNCTSIYESNEAIAEYGECKCVYYKIQKMAGS